MDATRFSFISVVVSLDEFFADYGCSTEIRLSSGGIRLAD